MSEWDKKVKEVRDELALVPKRAKISRILLSLLLVVFSILFMIWVSYIMALYVHDTHPDSDLHQRVERLEKEVYKDK